LKNVLAWLRTNTGPITAVATVALVLVTIAYVWLTGVLAGQAAKSSVAAEQSALHAGDAAQAAARGLAMEAMPIVTVRDYDVQRPSENVMTVTATVANVGRGAALGVELFVLNRGLEHLSAERWSVGAIGGGEALPPVEHSFGTDAPTNFLVVRSWSTDVTGRGWQVDTLLYPSADEIELTIHVNEPGQGWVPFNEWLQSTDG
jgi:hypothetical protein